MFQGIFKSAINDANKNYIFGTGSIPISIKVANLETFAKAENKQQGYEVAEVNKLISTMLTGWDANGNKPKSMSDNYLELILSCGNGVVVKKRLQFPHIIAWQDDSTPYNIADVYKQFSIDNWLKADDFENPDITLVVEPTDEILTTSTANPPEVTTTNSGRFYLYYRNLPVGVNRVHIEFHIKTKTEPIDFDLEIADGLSWKDAQTILAVDNKTKLSILFSSVKDVYKFTGTEGDFENITMFEWSALYQQIISLNPNNKFTHDLFFVLYEAEIDAEIDELQDKLLDVVKSKNRFDVSKITSGYYLDLSTGEATYINQSYNTSDKCEIYGGKTYHSSRRGASSYALRFIAFYDENGYLGQSTSLQNESTFTAPSNAKYVRFSYDNSASVVDVQLEEGSSATEYEPYFEDYYDRKKVGTYYIEDSAVTSEKINKDVIVPSTIPVIGSFGKDSASVYVNTMPNTNYISIQNFPRYLKSKIVYSVWAKVSSFNQVEISLIGNNGFSFVIDNTKIYYKNASGSVWSSAEHGLTINSFVSVAITQNGRSIKTILSTLGGYYIMDKRMADTFSVDLFGRPVFSVNSQTVLSNITFSVNSPSFKNNIWVIGDSYTSIFNERWTGHIVDSFLIDELLICGNPGAGSEEMYGELQKCLNFGAPKYLVWCLGMNDNTDVHNQFVNNVLSLCFKNGITPIIATIPSVPTINNEDKNAYTKSKNVRIVDFALGVNASPNGVWYEGCLSSDGVHPTELGAKALAARFISDVSEVLVANL